MLEAHTFIIPGVPVNYNAYNQLKQKEWTEQTGQLIAIKSLLKAQHHDQSPLKGKLIIQAHFFMPITRKQHHDHYLKNRYSVFNLIRFLQKVSERTIIAHNANICSFESSLRFSHNPRTVLTIERIP